MEWWQAAVLGLVEGITEYLPISSTGHLIIASSFLGLDTPERKEAVDAFNIVIQGGAILAVVGLYWPSVLRMLKGLVGMDAGGLKLLFNLFLGFLPSAVIGFLLHDWIEAKLFSVGPVVAALAVGGFYMMAIDQWRRGRFSLPRRESSLLEIDDVTPVQALKIGLLQCLALWPGTSRSMMTITGGLLVGLRPRAAAEFSFLLGLPTLSAACLYSLAKNVYNAKKHGTPNLIESLGATAVIVGLVVATVSAALAVKWLVGFLNRHGLTPFGWYRLALCVALVVLSAMGVVRIG
jgi:undecaprenyl-diphosphatase